MFTKVVQSLLRRIVFHPPFETTSGPHLVSDSKRTTLKTQEAVHSDLDNMCHG